MYRVLFLCIGNSIRSQLAEAIMNHISREKYKAYSAGSNPLGRVHPSVIEVLTSMKIPTQNLYSKSIDECLYNLEDEVSFDFIVSVCEENVNQLCPIYGTQRQAKLSKATYLNWNIPDPSQFLNNNGNYDLENLANYLMKTIKATFHV